MKRKLPRLLLMMWAQISTCPVLFAQLDSIFDQGVYRTFIVHTPSGYSPVNQYPIVLNFHGLNSNAAQEEAYSQFDHVADTAGFIVVYPNGISNSWAVANNTDVDFISHLIDTIRNNFSCNTCLFATGISDGGFMTYKLACALPKPLTAIAVVSGNMAKSLQFTCALTSGLPVMHFHGTSDVIVNYNGVPPLIPPVDTTIKWWVNRNQCSHSSLFTSIPNINLADSCTVEEYFYGGGMNGSEVIFYKIVNGGHTWPGAIPAPPLGKTNQDISASALMGSFFQRFCSSSVDVNSMEEKKFVSIFPNPAHQSIELIFDSQWEGGQVNILDARGNEIRQYSLTSSGQRIELKGVFAGLYLLRLNSAGKTLVKKFIVL